MARHCPLCHKPLPEGPVPYRPFCSWRCKLIDLGAWLEGSYRLSGPEGELNDGEPEEGPDEAPQGESREAPKRDEP